LWRNTWDRGRSFDGEVVSRQEGIIDADVAVVAATDSDGGARRNVDALVVHVRVGGPDDHGTATS
jgi:hypothetical protein